MKSVLISFLMFAAVLVAMYTGLFNLTSSVYMYVFAAVVLVIVLFSALKVLGNPFAKDVKHGKKKH